MNLIKKYWRPLRVFLQRLFVAMKPSLTFIGNMIFEANYSYRNFLGGHFKMEFMIATA